MHTAEKLCQSGISTIRTETQAIEALAQRIDSSFAKACDILLKCPERIIVMGMGKSSYIGGKIAATLASTGSPAFFVHPGEASHGDLGMITQNDVIMAISNSGETPELMTILPLIKHLKIPLIVLTGNTASTLANAADVFLDVSVKEEACPLGLAPTSSTTAALVMGDALAVALLEAKGITAADFARSHPGGRLGKRLLLRVSDIMRKEKEMPVVHQDIPLGEALMEISQKTAGMTVVVDNDGQLAGIFTDGDLRRVIDRSINVHTIAIKEVMSRYPKVITENKLAVEALQIMEDFRITSLVAVDSHNDRKPIGVIHMHDLLRAGVA